MSRLRECKIAQGNGHFVGGAESLGRQRAGNNWMKEMERKESTVHEESLCSEKNGLKYLACF